MNDPTRNSDAHLPIGHASVPEQLSVDGATCDPRFSPAVTWLMGLVLIAGIGFFVWLQISIPRLDRVAFPEGALPLMVSRTLDIEEAIAHAPLWERALYQMTTDSGSDDVSEAIDWYRELATVTYNPDIHMQLAILEGEAGRVTDVRRRVAEWDDRDAPFPLFAGMIRAAYLDEIYDPAIIGRLQAEAAEALSLGWFYNKLAMRLADRAGDPARTDAIREEAAARVAPLLEKVRVLTGIEMALIVSGLLALLTLLLWKNRLYPVGAAPIPPPWRGRTGITVLIRGGAVGMVLSLTFLFLESDSPLIRLTSIPVASVPLLVLTRQYLLTPHGVGFLTGFGLLPLPEGRGRLITAIAAVLAAGLVGEWGLGLIAERWHLSSHWTEWFDADLVWGDMPVLLVSLIEFVVLAPIFEELAFRGLLFGTLRRKFTWGSSAVISAGVFAVAHGYGVLGFAGVFWSGVLWAWIYEKTGSLLPSMAAHAANNMLVCLSMVYLFRF